MRGLAELVHDGCGGAGMKFVLVVALVSMPVLYPRKTLGVLKGAQASWEHLWTIEGMAGR